MSENINIVTMQNSELNDVEDNSKYPNSISMSHNDYKVIDFIDGTVNTHDPSKYLVSIDKYEYLLDPNNSRFCIFPIKDMDIFSAFETQQKSFWNAYEIDYKADLTCWETLTDNEKFFIENILAFFASSDGIVNENLSTNFIEQVTCLEAKFAYQFQVMMENTHNLTYSKLIDTFVSSSERKKVIFNAIREIPTIKKKTEWSMKYIDADKPFALRLLAFAIVEGLFFSGSFCAIFWLKSRGLMVNALGASNLLISRDEGMHFDFAKLLYGKIANRVKDEVFYDMMREAVNIESEFICSSIPCRLIGMNSDLMTQYITFVADRLSIELGYKKIYNATNPFDFMEKIHLETKANFFDVRANTYQLVSLDVTLNDEGKLEVDEDWK